MRPHAQGVTDFQPRNATAASTNFKNIHHRDLDWQGFFVTANQRTAGGERFAVADNAGLGRRATHVKRDGVAQAQLLTNGLRANHASGWPRLQHADTFAPRIGQRKQAASGLHRIKITLETLFGQMRFELSQIGRDARADIGIRGNGRDTFKLSVLLRQLVRCCDKNAWDFFLNNGLDAHFMRRIPVGVQQQNSDRFDVLCFQLPRHHAHRLFIQLFVNAAVGEQALRHFIAQRTLDQRFMFGEKQVVSVRAIDAANFINVAKTFGDQQGRARTTAFEQRVDGNRRAVQKKIAVLDAGTRAIECVLNAFDKFSVRGKRLAKKQLTAAFVKGDHVGEGAADVHGDAEPPRDGCF